MTTLYELSNQMIGLQHLMEDDDAEYDLTDTLDALEGDIQVKAENLLGYVSNLAADVSVIDTEIKRLQSRKKVIANRQESLREYLRFNMETGGIDKITCPLFTITLRKATDICVIDSEDLIPDEFKTIVTTTKIDKMAIKRAIKVNGIVEGVRLEPGKRGLMIK